MSSFKVFLDIQVRFSDTDAMGHVNNAVYLSYIELARMQYWRELTGLKDFSKVDLILARVEIDYRSPVFIDTDLRVWIRIPEIRRSSFLCEYRLEDRSNGRLLAEASSVQCLYDYSANKVKRIDKSLRDKIVAFETPNLVKIPEAVAEA